MCERRDTFEALIAAADNLIEACASATLRAITVPDSHVPGVARALRHAIRHAATLPSDMVGLLGKMK